MPPYSVTASQVGPYKLNERMASVLEVLESGPRIERFEIANVVHTSLVRAERGTILIGASEPTGSSTLVAVINRTDARTDADLFVGVPLAKLGTRFESSDWAADPRIAVTTAMASARFLTDDREVTAIAILADRAPPRPVPVDAQEGCMRPASERDRFGICLGGAPRQVEVDGERDELVIHTVEGKALATIHVPDVIFAAALRNPLDGRDDLVVVSRTDEPQQRSWNLVGFRLEGTRRITVVDPLPVYQLSTSQVRGIGVDLKDLELYLELDSKQEGIVVGGLLTTRANHKLRDVVSLLPVAVPRRTPSGEPK